MSKIKWLDENNLTLLMDFYELTMGNGYFNKGMKDKIAYFDMFFREIPDDGGYAIMAGVEQLIEYLENIKFTEESIQYLRSRNLFNEEFLTFLKNMKFECDVWAIPEGTPIFPGEPIVIVRGPVIQAQMIETMVLLSINHQSLIATKSKRIVRAAQGRPVMEFGSRRAQSYDGAVLGARAAYIAGCAGTACTITGEKFDVPVLGTMAHSWIQMFPTEYEAFETYARNYPDNCTLLVDTYNVLKSGVLNAIKVFDDVLKPLGKRPKGIRIDSGDITYLSKRARKMLDEAGYEDCGIVASNSLDEYIIKDILNQGACVDSFGVGERLITSRSNPVFSGVYKLVAIEEEGIMIPKIKISENVGKITNPGFKQVYRFFDKETGMAISDHIALYGEEISKESVEIFHPEHTWKRKTISNFEAKPLLVKIFEKGKNIYRNPSLIEIRENCEKQLSKIWEEVLRVENPHRYYVDLSQKLWDMKQELLKTNGIKK